MAAVVSRHLHSGKGSKGSSSSSSSGSSRPGNRLVISKQASRTHSSSSSSSSRLHHLAEAVAATAKLYCSRQLIRWCCVTSHPTQ